MRPRARRANGGLAPAVAIPESWTIPIAARKPPPRPFANRPPTHPGTLLRDDVLPALGLGVAETARRIGVSRQMVHDLLAGRHAFTPAMALRIGKLAGNGPALWLNMQQAHDLWHAERKLGAELARIQPCT